MIPDDNYTYGYRAGLRTALDAAIEVQDACKRPESQQGWEAVETVIDAVTQILDETFEP